MKKLTLILLIIVIIVFVVGFYRFNFTNDDIYIKTNTGKVIKYDEQNGNIDIDYSDLENIGEAIGDLDNDGIDERVVVYNTNRELELGTEREIHIYKKNKDDWQLWKTSIGAVLSSQHGGIMGDPFSEVLIENGNLKFSHFGGSRAKWSYSHTFKYQNNNWELIYVVITVGSSCDLWENLDYNLTTGQVIFETEDEDCSGGGDWVKTATETQEFVHILDSLPNMDGFYPGNNIIILPKSNREFYY